MICFCDGFRLCQKGFLALCWSKDVQCFEGRKNYICKSTAANLSLREEESVVLSMWRVNVRVEALPSYTEEMKKKNSRWSFSPPPPHVFLHPFAYIRGPFFSPCFVLPQRPFYLFPLCMHFFKKKALPYCWFHRPKWSLSVEKSDQASYHHVTERKIEELRRIRHHGVKVQFACCNVRRETSDIPFITF